MIPLSRKGESNKNEIELLAMCKVNFFFNFFQLSLSPEATKRAMVCVYG